MLKYVADYESHKVPYFCGEQAVADPGLDLLTSRAFERARPENQANDFEKV